MLSLVSDQLCVLKFGRPSKTFSTFDSKDPFLKSTKFFSQNSLVKYLTLCFYLADSNDIFNSWISCAICFKITLRESFLHIETEISVNRLKCLLSTQKTKKNQIFFISSMLLLMLKLFQVFRPFPSPVIRVRKRINKKTCLPL